MKKFMKTCYKFGAKVQIGKRVKEGITLDCLKCPKCGEVYFTSSEINKLKPKCQICGKKIKKGAKCCDDLYYDPEGIRDLISRKLIIK